MSKKEKVVKKVKEIPQVQIQTGNIEILKVKLLSDISTNLKRIADALEK